MASIHWGKIQGAGMSRDERPRDEWLDPTAPTEAMGEAAALEGDLVHYWIPNLMEELSKFGVNVQWVGDPDDGSSRYEFICDKREYAAIAKLAYEIAACHHQAIAERRHLDDLSEKLMGHNRSLQKRRKAADEKREKVLQQWAMRLENGDEVSIETLATSVERSVPTIYNWIAEAKEQIQKRASKLREQMPSPTTEKVAEDLVQKFSATTPWVNRHTVREALAGWR